MRAPSGRSIATSWSRSPSPVASTSAIGHLAWGKHRRPCQIGDMSRSSEPTDRQYSANNPIARRRRGCSGRSGRRDHRHKRQSAEDPTGDREGPGCVHPGRPAPEPSARSERQDLSWAIPGPKPQEQERPPVSSHQTFLTVTGDLAAETERRNRHEPPVPCKGIPRGNNDSHPGASIKTPEASPDSPSKEGRPSGRLHRQRGDVGAGYSPSTRAMDALGGETSTAISGKRASAAAGRGKAWSKELAFTRGYGRDRSSPPQRAPGRAALRSAARATTNLDRGAEQIDDPDLRNAEFCVERKLGAPIVGERAFRHFDKKETSAAPGWLAR